MDKPNCYKCLYRSNLPGDAHSCCKHPEIEDNSNMFTVLANTFSGKNSEIAKKLEIRANAHGVRSGWFMWPANFDPVWLENCNGFTNAK